MSGNEAQVFMTLYFDEDVEIEISLRLAGRGWDVNWRGKPARYIIQIESN